MMDLTKKGLPNVVMIGGSPFSIYTDYRVWMRFENSIKNLKPNETVDIGYLFKNDKPMYCNIYELFEFSRPKAELPRQIGQTDGVISFDFVLDADLIYAAFLGQYGIDLIEVKELHWHKFLALFNGLNESTRLREVMGYRNYRKETRKYVDVYAEMREAWAIEQPMSAEDIAALEEFNKTFGG